MKPEELYWSLMNKVDQKRHVTGLTFEQTRFVVSLIPLAQRDQWLAWHEGLKQWEPINHFKVFNGDDGAPRMSSPPFPPQADGSEMQFVVGEDPEVEEVVKRTVSPANSPPQVDKRMTRRFLKEFSVHVTGADGKTYKSSTLNLSSSGMLLADKLPDSVGKSFSCLISREDGSQLKVFCSLVRESGVKSGKSSRIKFLDVSQPKVLLNWLVDSKIR